MNVTFNLNYLLVFGLLICIVILVCILIKFIFDKENSLQKEDAAIALSEKERGFFLHENIDFFKKSSKIIDKTDILKFTENNITYQFIDIGNKIIIMEEKLYIPEPETVEKENEILNDMNQIQFYQTEDYISNVSDTNDIEKSLLNDSIEKYSTQTKNLMESDFDQLQKEIANNFYNHNFEIEEEEATVDLNAELELAIKDVESDFQIKDKNNN